MTYDPARHHRRSIRLPAYDYTQPGAYFVTICSQNRECLFGDVISGEMILNQRGEMVERTWRELAECYPGVEVDAFVVMPNHVHGIIVLVGANPLGVGPVGAGPRACPEGPGPCPGRPQGVAPTMSLPDVVHRFKSLTTTRYRTGVLQDGWQPFPGRLWQRNYYEHVIRDEEELNRIQQYIIDNPGRWEDDVENPDIRSNAHWARARTATGIV
jgi:REP element-mobilizing transposase RayT